MPAIPFARGSYRRRAGRLPEIRLVNAYLEATKDGDLYLLPRPGLEAYSSVGTGPIRGVFAQDGTLDGDLLTISGNGFYRNSTYLGIIEGTERVSITANATSAWIATGDKIYNSQGAGLTEYAFPDDAGVVWVGRLGGYFLAIRNGTHRLYYGDGTTWNALDFTSAERMPDPLVGGLVVDDVLLLFGTETVEFFAQTADADAPFQRIEQRLYSRGCKARDTIALVDNAAFWVTDDGQVVRGGAVPERVSSNSIEERIANTDDADLTAFRLSWQGHEFYVLTTAEGTFAYDASTQEWSEFGSYGRTSFRAHVGTMVGDAAILGDDETGQLYRLTDEVATDNGETIQRIFTAIASTDKAFTCYNLTLDAAVGQTADLSGQGADPVIEMRYSDDYGNTWGPWEAVSLGRQGEYRVRPVWNGLGLIDAPGRVWEFRTTDPAPWRISRVAMNEDLRGAAR